MSSIGPYREAKTLRVRLMHPASKLAEPLGKLSEVPDLHAVLRELRRAEPVAWCEPRQCWIVTSYELVAAAFEDPRLSNRRTALLVRAQVGETGAPIAADFERVVSSMMLMRDGDEHKRLRTHGTRGLTPLVLERARPRIAKIANELLDACLAKQSFDLLADFSEPYPARVIAALFDLSVSERDMFQEPSEAIARFFGATMRDPLADAAVANQATLEMESFFRELLVKRKQSPGEDLMSLFMRGQRELELSDDEVCAQCIVLLAGGHVTTKNQLANAIHPLLTTPGAYDELCAQPDLAERAAEESLRHDSSVPFVFRLAAEDLQLGDRKIAQGEMVLLGLTAANRDPLAFENPDRFDLHRQSKQRHLALGQGQHYCIGAGLARLEISIALAAIAQRMPNLRLDPQRPPQRWCESMVFRGFESLSLLS